MAKPNWSPADIDRIIELHDEGLSYRQIEKITTIPFGTCRRLYAKHSKNQPYPPRKLKEKIESAEEIPAAAIADQPPANAVTGSPQDPILFRFAKLAEIESDIMQTRQRGQMQVLPTLHRMHLQVHDELLKLKSDTDEFSTLTPDELLQSIVSAVHGLPPLLRHQLDDQLLNSNIVQFPDAKKDESAL